MPTKFEGEHGRMVALADEILHIARTRPADAAAQLTRARLRLSREVSAHCRDEVAALNSRSNRDRTAERRALVRQYHDDLLRWRHDLIACNSQWPPARVLEQADGFVRAFGPIARRLRERVRWEEEVFYPAVLYADRAKA